MSSTERVMRALSFRLPDRVPPMDSHLPELVDVWRLISLVRQIGKIE